jgi:hypothetical protein
MSEYRVYCLDLEGRGLDVQLIDALNDKEAIRKAQALDGLRQCEVWSGNRLIAKVTRFEREEPVHLTFGEKSRERDTS